MANKALLLEQQFQRAMEGQRVRYPRDGAIGTLRRNSEGHFVVIWDDGVEETPWTRRWAKHLVLE